MANHPRPGPLDSVPANLDDRLRRQLEILQAENLALRNRLQESELRAPRSPDDFASAVRGSLDTMQRRLADTNNPVSRFAVKELKLDTAVHVGVTPLGTLEYQLPALGEEVPEANLSRLSLTVAPLPQPESAAIWDGVALDPETLVDDLPSLGERDRLRLKQNDVYTLGELLTTGTRARGRVRLAGLLEVDRRRLGDWLCQASLMLVRGVDGTAAEILAAAGIHSLEQLAAQHPRSVAERYNQRLERMAVPGRLTLPDAAARAWVDAARRFRGGEAPDPPPPEAGGEPLTELPGIAPHELRALDAASIDDAGKLRWRTRNDQGREGLARRTGIAKERLLTWVERPYLVRLLPAGGRPGDAVRIEGGHLRDAAATGRQVRFGEHAAEILDWAETAIEVRVPEGALPGPLTVAVGGVETHALPWRGPALDLGARDLIFRPAQPRPGDQVTFEVTLFNAGEDPVPTAALRWIVDGEAEDLTLDGLEPGAQRTLSLVRELGAGSHQASFTVDPELELYLPEARPTILRRQLEIPGSGEAPGNGQSVRLDKKWLPSRHLANGRIEGGRTITTEIAARNPGPRALAEVELSDRFDPEALAWVDSEPAAVLAGEGDLRWHSPALVAGDELAARATFRTRPRPRARRADNRAGASAALGTAGGPNVTAADSAPLVILPRLIDLEGLGVRRVKRLFEAGIERVEQLAAASPKTVAAVTKTSPALAAKLVATARAALEP